MHSKRNFSMTIHRAKGFTLIELMIVVAIIGILAAIAIPAYDGYIRTSRMTKCNDHFDTARRYIEEGFKADAQRRTLGIPYAGVVAQGDFPNTDVGIVTQLNPGGTAISPEGGLQAFIAGGPGAGTAATCQIEIGVPVAPTGPNGGWATGNTVTITRPIYLDMVDPLAPAAGPAAVTITLTY